MIHEILILNNDKSPVGCTHDDTLTQKVKMIFVWIKDNYKFISQAKCQSIPPLERVKFLATFAHNLDEFFMHKVSKLHLIDNEIQLETNPDIITDTQLLDDLYSIFTPILEEQNLIWRDELVPALQDRGVIIHAYDTLHPKQKIFMRNFFHTDIFPILTPLAFDKSHPFPLISNNALNLAIIIKHKYVLQNHFVRIKIPTDIFPRLINLSDIGHMETSGCHDEFIFLEEIIVANLDLLFPGMEISAVYPFRVTRNVRSRYENLERNNFDYENHSDLRFSFGIPVRIEVSSEMDRITCGVICDKLTKYSRLFYRTKSPVGMADIVCLYNLDRPDLKNS